MSGHIAVVGSINRDTVLGVARFPTGGETVLGRHLGSFPGGKGANQAVAAARLGRTVVMVGRVGDDPAGAAARAELAGEGVDVDAVGIDPEAATGAALILVDDVGENTIVVVPGANGRLGPHDVAVAAGALGAAAVTLVQLEVPMGAVAEAVRSSGGLVVLNAAPARNLPAEVRGRVDVLVVNRSELAVLADAAEPATVAEIVALAAGLAVAGAVVVTAGAAGAVVIADGAVTEVPSVDVDAVDTTGAGDAFCGGLADALARGLPLLEANRWAVRVGAAATTRLGAQEALPTVDEVAEVGA